MKRIGNLFAFYLLLSFSGICFAKVQVQVESFSNKQALGRPFAIQVKVKTNTKSESISVQPQVPQFNNKQINFQGTSQQSSSSTRIANGQMSFERSQTINFNFVPIALGNLQVNSLSVVANGKKHSFGPFKFNVVQADKLPKKRPQGAGSIFNQFFGSLDDDINGIMDRFMGEPNAQVEDEVAPHELYFIDLKVSNFKPYKNESINVQWHLYLKGRLSRLDHIAYPSLEGFWKEDIYLATSYKYETVYRAGERWTRIKLAEYNLTPLELGEMIVDPYVSRIHMYPQTPFGSRSKKTEEINSDQGLLQVQPLPQEGLIPNINTSAVGIYDIKANIDSDIKSGMPFSYELTVYGEGNAKMAEFPKVEWPENFSVYNESTESSYVQPNRFAKTKKYLLVPKNTGSYTLPKIDLQFFNPIDQAYYIKSAAQKSINVVQGVELDNKASVGLEEMNKEKPFEYINRSWSFYSFLQWLFSILSLLLGFKVFKQITIWYKNRKKFEKVSIADLLEDKIKFIDSSLKGNKIKDGQRELINLSNFLLGVFEGRRGTFYSFDKSLNKISPAMRRKYGKRLKELYDEVTKLKFKKRTSLSEQDQNKKVKQIFKEFIKIKEEFKKDELI